MKPARSLVLLAASILACGSLACGSDPVSPPWAAGFSCDTDPWPQATGTNPPDLMGYRVGERVGLIEGTDQCGRPVSLEQFAGSVILLDVGATWCGPCVNEARGAQAFLDGFRARHGYPFWRFQILLDVTEDREESEALTHAWAERFGLAYPCLAGEAIRGVTLTGLRVRAVPTFFLIGPDLVIRDRFEGWDSSTNARIEDRVLEIWKEYETP